VTLDVRNFDGRSLRRYPAPASPVRHFVAWFFLVYFTEEIMAVYLTPGIFELPWRIFKGYISNPLNPILKPFEKQMTKCGSIENNIDILRIIPYSSAQG
jgi:hypothetical protein